MNKQNEKVRTPEVPFSSSTKTFAERKRPAMRTAVTPAYGNHHLQVALRFPNLAPVADQYRPAPAFEDPCRRIDTDTETDRGALRDAR